MYLVYENKIHSFKNEIGLYCFPISNNISVTSRRSGLLVEETGVPGENHRPAANHRQTLSHNVVSGIPRHERDSNSQFYW